MNIFTQVQGIYIYTLDRSLHELIKTINLDDYSTPGVFPHLYDIGKPLARTGLTLLRSSIRSET